MSTWIAAIVEAAGRTDLWAVAAQHDVSPIDAAVGAHVLIDCGTGFDLEASTRLARSLSNELQASAVGLCMQTGADVYGVRAFDRGAEVRRLDYARDSGRWVAIEGTPQPWEPAFFFDGRADLSPRTPWPDTLSDDLSDEDIAAYEKARREGDPAAVMGLVHASAGAIHRVARFFDVDPARPSGRWQRPSLLARLFSRRTTMR